MYRTVCFLVLVASVHCQITNNLDPNVLAQIFGTADDATSSTTTTTTTTSTTQQPASDRNQDSPTSTFVPPPNFAAYENVTCPLEDGTMGECVAFYLCNKNGSLNTEGDGLLDIRVGDTDPPCGSYMITCCATPDTRPVDDPIKPVPGPRRKGCGWRNPLGADMRTTGETLGETKFGEFPWMVAILEGKVKPTNNNGTVSPNVYVGGGSLIHPSVVLTAAHYVAKLKDLRIRAGEWDTQKNSEIYTFQERDVASLAVHKDFNKGNLFYDVAVLFLEQPVDLTLHIGVACLPPPRERTQPGTRCFATGWGNDKFGKAGRYQVILKKIEVPVVDRNTCQAALRHTRLGKHFQLHSSFMCAGGEKGIDTCKGDGGSPLSCPIEFEEDRFVQSGIVAWGIGCGDDGTPGVYVDVSIMRDWIDNEVRRKGYDTDTYKY